MSDMLIKMELTLLDAASGPLSVFMDKLKAIDAVVAQLNTKLSAFSSNMAAVASGSTEGAAGVSKMEASVGALAAGLTAADALLKATTAGVVELGLGAEAAAAKIGLMGGALGSAKADVAGLSGSMKGLMALWSAFEVKKALLGSVHAAADYQTAQMELRSFNMLPADQAYALQQAKQLADKTPYLDYGSSLKARTAGIAGLGDTSSKGAAILDQVLPTFITVANNLMRLGMKGNMEDTVRNIAAVMEARQITADPKSMIETAGLLQKVVTGSGMKLNVQDMETVMRQMKYGASQNISNEGLLKLMSYVEQLKVSGGGSGGARGVSMAGTAITAMERWGLGGKMNKQAAEIMAEMGILDPGKIRNDSSTTSTNVGPGALINASQMSQDPIGWLHQYGPAFVLAVLTTS